MAESTLKSLLECSICEEIMIGVGILQKKILIHLLSQLKVASRICTHSFCHHCATNWLKQSTNCPICRDVCYLIVKNPFIDRFIDLFVVLTFTEEEKTERSTLIQHRSMSSSNVIEEHAALFLPTVYEPSLDTSLVTRNVRMLNARSLLVQMFNNDQFNQLIDDDNCDLDSNLSIVDEMLDIFSDDGKSLQSIFETFSPSLKARYDITFPLPS